MTKMKPQINDPQTSAVYDADVVAIVDDVLANPARAEDAKALLTRKLSTPDGVRLAVRRSVPKSSTVGDEVDDDMWDNLPV